MPGTSSALKRLGVAALGASVMSVGLVGFTATNAFAAQVNQNATGVTITPTADSATVGTCNPFTVHVTPNPGNTNNYAVTVNISQAAATATTGNPANTGPTTTIGFCDVSNFTTYPGGASGNNPQTQPNPLTTQGYTTTNNQNTPNFPATPGNPGTAGATASGQNATLCPNPTNGQTAAQSANGGPTTTSHCQATFNTDSNGDVTFGVTSDTAGSMNVLAGIDKNQNGAIDTGEPQAAATKTWVANTTGTTAQGAAISCSPTQATNPTGSTHKFICHVTNNGGTPATGLTNVSFEITSGPDSTTPPTVMNCPEDASTATGTAGGNNGNYDCMYNNNGTPGTDNITAWVDLNNNGVVDSGEPSQTNITKTWVQSAGSTSQVSVTCSPNQTQTQPTATPANGNSGTDSFCQDPLTDKTATFTAHVTNGVNSTTPQVGIVVQWAISNNNGGGPGEPASDTETISPATCTTDNTGSCSTTLTDNVPTEGESITVTATVQRQGGTAVQASGTKVWHKPSADEARNITVTPHTATQPQGGAQTLVASVVDRFNNPVSGVCVGWNESGPGRFSTSDQIGCFTQSQFGNQTGSYATTCVTGSNGTCSVDVLSQTTESGAETITATIDPGNYPNNGMNGTGPAQECASTAGNSFFSPSTGNPGFFNPINGNNANGANNAAPGAPAGNCSDTATVTWTGTNNNGGGNNNAGVDIAIAQITPPASHTAGQTWTFTITTKNHADQSNAGGQSYQLFIFEPGHGWKLIGQGNTDSTGHATVQYNVRYVSKVLARHTQPDGSFAFSSTLLISPVHQYVHLTTAQRKSASTAKTPIYSIIGVSWGIVPNETFTVYNKLSNGKLWRLGSGTSNSTGGFAARVNLSKGTTYHIIVLGSGKDNNTGIFWLNSGFSVNQLNFKA